MLFIIDFPKSGKPAILSEDLIVRKFPDFMQKKDKESYQSKKVLGHIYRSIDKSDYKDYMSMLTEEAAYDTRLHVPGMEYYIGEARELRSDYNRDLLGLMNQSGVQTEAEIVSGYIIKWLKKGKSKTRYEQHDSTMRAVKSFKSLWRKEFEKEFLEESKNTIDMTKRASIEAKAAAWYYVTYHPEERQRDYSEQGGFLSFPWVIYDYICDIAKKNTHRAQDTSLSLPIPETVIEEEHAKHMLAKKAMENRDNDDKEPIVEIVDEDDEDTDYESDFSEDNEAIIYSGNTSMFTFNNSELRRAVQELNISNDPENSRSSPQNNGHVRPTSNNANQPVIQADASNEDLMKILLS